MKTSQELPMASACCSAGKFESKAGRTVGDVSPSPLRAERQTQAMKDEDTTRRMKAPALAGARHNGGHAAEKETAALVGAHQEGDHAGEGHGKSGGEINHGGRGGHGGGRLNSGPYVPAAVRVVRMLELGASWAADGNGEVLQPFPRMLALPPPAWHTAADEAALSALRARLEAATSEEMCELRRAQWQAIDSYLGLGEDALAEYPLGAGRRGNSDDVQWTVYRALRRVAQVITDAVEARTAALLAECAKAREGVQS